MPLRTFSSVDHLVAELGIHMSKDQVSRICRELDEQVEAFRTRPLEGERPYLWRVVGQFETGALAS